jgi:hypothetical protein
MLQLHLIDRMRERQSIDLNLLRRWFEPTVSGRSRSVVDNSNDC